MSGTRKKTAGGTPVPKEQSGMAERKEGLKAENVVLGNCHLPLEICQHLFKKLDSEEKTTFSRALVPWHELVSKERPDFLCSKGAPILVEHLPRKALLQCRTLSRSWTQEQDQHYQDHPVHVRLRFEIASSGKKEIPKLINCFNSAAAIQNFLEDMKEHPGNPFPGSNVYLIRFGQRGSETEFWNSSLQLFQRFGKHVKYVKLVDVALQCLLKCLLKLPNLKGLSIMDLCDDSSPYLPNLQNFLPRLRNLEMLEIGLSSKYFIDAVLESCPIPENMKRLSIRLTRIPEVVYRFKNLEVLQANLDILELQKFSNLASLPPLRDVDLFFHTPIAAHEVFRALEPFSNTLINLEGWQMTTYHNLRWINTNINLPNLRKLKLYGFNGSLDPFIKLTSLTDMIVVCLDSQKYVKGCQVEFYGFKKPLKDSNIWTLIPSLKRLTVGDATTYRPLTPKQNRRSKRKCVLNAKRYV